MLLPPRVKSTSSLFRKKEQEKKPLEMEQPELPEIPEVETEESFPKTESSETEIPGEEPEVLEPKIEESSRSREDLEKEYEKVYEDLRESMKGVSDLPSWEIMKDVYAGDYYGVLRSIERKIDWESVPVEMRNRVIGATDRLLKIAKQRGGFYWEDVSDLFQKSIQESHLSEEKASQYEGAIKELLSRIPELPRRLISKELKEVRFFEDSASLDQAAYNLMVSVLGKEEADLQVGRSRVSTRAGVYFRTLGTVFLDGNHTMNGPGKTLYEAEPVEIYAHELGHAIDGENHRYSESNEWRDVFYEEIYTEAHPLSYYASVGGPSEAFAEFCRLLYGYDTSPGYFKQIQKILPKACQLFQEWGLWPG